MSVREMVEVVEVRITNGGLSIAQFVNGDEGKGSTEMNTERTKRGYAATMLGSVGDLRMMVRGIGPLSTTSVKLA